LEELENAALFLRSGLLSILIHHEKKAFQKCSSNLAKKFKKNFKTELFENDDLMIIVQWTVFNILKFSLAARLRGHKQRKLNDHVYSFLLFVSSRPHYQTEF